MAEISMVPLAGVRGAGGHVVPDGDGEAGEPGVGDEGDERQRLRKKIRTATEERDLLRTLKENTLPAFTDPGCTDPGSTAGFIAYRYGIHKDRWGQEAPPLPPVWRDPPPLPRAQRHPPALPPGRRDPPAQVQGAEATPCTEARLSIRISTRRADMQPLQPLSGPMKLRSGADRGGGTFRQRGSNRISTRRADMHPLQPLLGASKLSTSFPHEFQQQQQPVLRVGPIATQISPHRGWLYISLHDGS